MRLPRVLPAPLPVLRHQPEITDRTQWQWLLPLKYPLAIPQSSTISYAASGKHTASVMRSRYLAMASKRL